MGENATLHSFKDGSPSVDKTLPPQRSTTSSNLTDSDEYGTPRWLIRKLTNALSEQDGASTAFDLDPTSGAEPTPIADLTFTITDDGLSKSWTETPSGKPISKIYLNPPYSDPEPFLRKLKNAVNPNDSDSADLGVSLTKADTSTEWFHKHLTEARVLCFLDSRLSFHGGKGDANFASVLSVFGKPPRQLLETLSQIGKLYTQIEVETALEQHTLEDLIADGGYTAAAIPITKSSETGISTDHTTLDFVSPHDQLHMTFETDSLGVANTVPDEVHLQVLPNGKEIIPETGTVIIDAIGETPTGKQVCVRIKNSAEIASHLETSIAVGTGHWTLTTPKNVTICSR